MSTLSSAVASPGSPVLLTAEEFMARHAHTHAELVEGVVKEYPMPSTRHGKICLTIGRLLGNHVESQDLGHTMSNDSWIRTGSNPDSVRGADVCYFSYERLPRGPVPEGLLPMAPDLVVEVRSPSDRWTELFAKVSEYLRSGVRVVVILDPASTSASVYRDDELQQIFHNGDQLILPDVLPGFSATVSRLFS